MSKLALVMGLTASMAACTGRGIDRTDAVPVRTSLSVRPVADGDPWVETIAATAQGTLAGPAIEVVEVPIVSRSLPSVRSQQVYAGTKQTLVDLVARAESAPAGLVAGYERQRDDRWALVVMRVDDGMVLGPDTLVKLSWATEPGEPSDPEGVYLLLDRDDGERFERLTIEHDGRRLAIADGEDVLMVPTVQEPIGGGQLLISAGEGSTAAELYERLAGRPAPPRP